MSLALNLIARESGPVAEIMVKMHCESTKDVFDQIVFVDNGCSPEVREIFEDYSKKDSANWVIVDKPGNFTFSQLRDEALVHTKKANIDWIVWQDADDILNPNDWREINKSILSEKKISQVSVRFYHFMGSPYTIQVDRGNYFRPTFFRITKDSKWGCNVHEQISGLAEGEHSAINEGFFHFGYALKPVYLVFLRWLHYDWLEKGNIDTYIDQGHKSESWAETGNGDPMCILDHRFTGESIIKFPGVYPKPLDILFEHVGSLQKDDIKETVDLFQNWLIETNKDQMWTEWQAKKEEVGNWADTYNWALQKYMER